MLTRRGFIGTVVAALGTPLAFLGRKRETWTGAYSHLTREHAEEQMRKAAAEMEMHIPVESQQARERAFNEMDKLVWHTQDPDDHSYGIPYWCGVKT